MCFYQLYVEVLTRHCAQSRGWLRPNGRPPMNLDLFRKLDAAVTRLANAGVTIGFWHVLRGYNTRADELARDGAYKAVANTNTVY